MRPPHTQIIIFHNEPPFHSCIYYIVIDDEYQKFKLITNQFLKFRFVDILLYHKSSRFSISITPFCEKVKLPHKSAGVLAGVVRIELTTRGFGDRCSTS